MTNTKNIQKLIKDVQEKIRKNEYNTVTLKGIKNLSRSDLEMIVMYAEHYLKNGSFNGLMDLMGNNKKVFEKYGISTNNNPFSIW